MDDIEYSKNKCLVLGHLDYIGAQLTANDLASIIQTSFGAYAFDLENYFSSEYDWENE